MDFVSWVFSWVWSLPFCQIPSGVAFMLVWRVDMKKKLEDRMIFSLNGGFPQVCFYYEPAVGPIANIVDCSDCWRSSGYYRAFHLCLDDLSACALDCSNHWQCVLWRRVSCFRYFYPSNRSWSGLLTHPCCVTRTILVYSGIFTFLVDAYPTYAASALAANSFTRSTFGGVFPLFGTQSKSRLPSGIGIWTLCGVWMRCR